MSRAIGTQRTHYALLEGGEIETGQNMFNDYERLVDVRNELRAGWVARSA